MNLTSNIPAFMANDPDAMTVTDKHANPPRFHFLAIWKHPRDGKFSPLWNAANSAHRELGAFFLSRGTIMENSRLSDAAKLEDVRAKAIDTFRAIGQAQRQLNGSVEGIDAERMSLAGVPKGDAAQTIVDVEIARHLKGLVGDERMRFIAALTSGAEPRAVDAVLRMPLCLTGLTSEMASAIAEAAIERAKPAEVRAIRELDAAVTTAQRVLVKCAEILSNATAIELGDLIRAYGDGAWQNFVKGPREPMEALARRYLADSE